MQKCVFMKLESIQVIHTSYVKIEQNFFFEIDIEMRRVFGREIPNPIPIEKEMGAHTIRIKCSIVQFLFFMAPSLYCRVLNNGQKRLQQRQVPQ